MQNISKSPQSFFKVIATAANSQLAEMVLSAGASTGGPQNQHATSEQWLYVVSGEGEAILDGEKIDLEAGNWLLIEAGETHEIRNTGQVDLQTFNLYAPQEY